MLASIGYREIKTFAHCWWTCKKMQLLWKKCIEVSKKNLKTEFHDPAIPFLVIYPKHIEIRNLKRYEHSYVHCRIIHHSQACCLFTPSASTTYGKWECWRWAKPWSGAVVPLDLALKRPRPLAGQNPGGSRLLSLFLDSPFFLGLGSGDWWETMLWNDVKEKEQGG